MIKDTFRKIWYKYPGKSWQRSRLLYWFDNVIFTIRKYFIAFTPIYINTINITKLWREWRKVKDIWKKPSVMYQCFNNTTGKWWRILDIQIYPLLWKWKFTDINWERNPQVHIILFNYWSWHWMLCSPDYKDDGLYWESICYYLYDKECKYNLYMTYTNNIYTVWAKDPKINGTTTDIRKYLNDKYYNYINKQLEKYTH